MATRRAAPRLPETAPVRLNLGRLAVLVLLLVAAAFYVAPLRQFFAQQDRYQREVAVLEREQHENQALRRQLDRMHSRDFVVRQAREEFQLVPAGMQAFVVKGLPEDRSTQRPTVDTSPTPAAPSIVARLRDLWQTLRR